MSTVEEFPLAARRPTEYDLLLAGGPTVLEAFPAAAYLCDAAGVLVSYNSEAARLWGRAPDLQSQERFCGSHRLFLPDQTPLPHEHCPMAAAVIQGTETRNAEVVIERPDGSRCTVMVNIRPLKNHRGEIQGAVNCFQDITARKAMEQELRDRNRDLEDFFENSAVGLHVVSGEGIILRANKAELEMLGYTAEEYVGRHIAEFHADAPVIGEILQRLALGQQLVRQPARLRAKDGSIKHVLITSNGRFAEGRMMNTRCFTSDVTDLYQAEHALRDSEGRLAATYNAATIGISEADEHGNLLRVNDAFCKMLGRTREQLLSMNFADYTHESDRANDLSHYARQVRGEIPSYAIRKRAYRIDGTMLYLDVHSSSVRDANGRFQYGVRVLQDVTAAQNAENRLRESERQMRDLLEALPAAVYTTDAAGRITFYNKAAVEMAGRTPSAGEQWCVTWRLYTPDGVPLPHDQCPMAIALKEDRPVRGAEAIAERPDGTRVPFVPFPTPLHDADGKLIGAINMLVDISDRKHAENRQKVLIDELNHRVKNTLATVQSLAMQTARHAGSLPGFVDKFQARLMALARAHDLLTESRWEHAPLQALASQLLAPMADAAPGRVSIGGPPIALTPRAAVALTMAINELATNAAKYGSLSSDEGTLLLQWSLRDSPEGRAMLAIEWREHGGPAVLAPTRRGFGRRLMQRCIETDLRGSLDLNFDAEGLRCQMMIPIASCAANV
nr:PAS domain S-box protein [uncultured Steroidobacter sp.]